MNEILMKIIIDTITFYANCDEDVLDDDVAVSKLEEIGFQMRKLSKEEIVLFRNYTIKISQKFEGKIADFYKAIPDNLGL